MQFLFFIHLSNHFIWILWKRVNNSHIHSLSKAATGPRDCVWCKCPKRIIFSIFLWRIDFWKFGVKNFDMQTSGTSQSSRNHEKCCFLVFFLDVSHAQISFQDGSKCQLSSPTASNDSLEKIKSQDVFSIWALFRPRNRTFWSTCWDVAENQRKNKNKWEFSNATYDTPK